MARPHSATATVGRVMDRRQGRDTAVTGELARRRLTRPPRRLLVAAAVVVAAILLLAQNSTVLFPEFSFYRLVDQRTIAVTVAVAPCAWTRVTGLAETAESIAVKVETLPCPLPLPGTSQLDLRELTVSVRADIGNRAITDAHGQPIPLRATGP
jgi:hypothetical protein